MCLKNNCLLMTMKCNFCDENSDDGILFKGKFVCNGCKDGVVVAGGGSAAVAPPPAPVVSPVWPLQSNMRTFYPWKVTSRGMYF